MQAAAAVLSAAAAAAVPLTAAQWDARFAAFTARFARSYPTNAERERRRDIFAENMARVAAAGNPALGETRFADLTRDEFAAAFLHTADAVDAEEGALRAARPAYDGKCAACARFPEMANWSADALDWTTKGAVTGVKDQVMCDSCYAFGATGDMEAAWFMAGNALVSLSEQQLLSCAPAGPTGKQGCGGGSRSKTFDYVIDNGGVTSEQNWPYNSAFGGGGACNESKAKQVVAAFGSYMQVSHTADGEDQIMDALIKSGPLSIGVSAAHMEYYSGGIDDPASCNQKHDHAILLVGYGQSQGNATSPSVKYWKIKNSWGKGFGEDGFLRVVRGKNWCGMATDAVHMRVGTAKRYHCNATTHTCAEYTHGHSTMALCQEACTGHSAPPTPAPPPSPATPPPSGPRYHCDAATYECSIATTGGHSTLEKCQTACLAPGYVCDTPTGTCKGVATNGTMKHVCESNCTLVPKPGCDPPKDCNADCVCKGLGTTCNVCMGSNDCLMCF